MRRLRNRTALLTGLSVAIALGAPLAAQAQASPPRNVRQFDSNAQPNELHLSNTELVLKSKSEPGLYQSDGVVALTVGSYLPRWAITAVASPAQGPGGATISPDQLFLTASGAQGGLKRRGRPLSLGKAVNVARGGSTLKFRGGMAQVTALGVGVRIDPAQPAGVYRGTIAFVFGNKANSPTRSRSLIRSAKSQSHADGVLSYSMTVVEFLTIHLDPAGLQFGSVHPNLVHETLNALPLSLQTNDRQAEVLVAMTGLQGDNGSGVITTDNIALAWGYNPDQARRNARQTRLGQSSFVWHPNPGQHTIFLVARIGITVEMPAASYSGILNVTGTSGQS